MSKENNYNECELLKNCNFLQKYNEINEVACNILISLYCKGAKQNDCKRKEYRIKTGTPPDSNMMPNGKSLKP
ncbi:MAG: hypothetical protein Q8920_09505 [Bacillota bacterium]|nr:hypothetical protein [Bacillota bacterium]